MKRDPERGVNVEVLHRATGDVLGKVRVVGGDLDGARLARELVQQLGLVYPGDVEDLVADVVAG